MWKEYQPAQPWLSRFLSKHQSRTLLANRVRNNDTAFVRPAGRILVPVLQVLEPLTIARLEERRIWLDVHIGYVACAILAAGDGKEHG